jgi:thymidylate kinase
MKKGIDLVISGCDFSGTSTQVNGLAKHLADSGRRVRDISGTELDAIFHAERFRNYNHDFGSLKEFMACPDYFPEMKEDFILEASKLLQKLRFPSMVRNEISEFIDPESADVWVMNEPTGRGSGQTVRTFELFRSKYGDKSNQAAAAYAHQAYRSEEFFRFRKALREAGKIIIRSRSEESACYQIFDEEASPGGVSRDTYLNLPGHRVAFGNPPTNIFVVTGPEDWTVDDYVKLKSQRTDGRVVDDYEKDAPYQLMVNRRYASRWINELYEEGSKMNGSQPPEITRFDIYDSKEEVIGKMISELDKIRMKSS